MSVSVSFERRLETTKDDAERAKSLSMKILYFLYLEIGGDTETIDSGDAAVAALACEMLATVLHNKAAEAEKRAWTEGGPS